MIDLALRVTADNPRCVRVFGTSLFALALLSLPMGCQKPVAKPPAPKPPEVVVAYPIVDQVQEYEETTGRLVARESVDVRSRVSGYLDKTFFADGANVQEGQPLFQIDARPYDMELQRAKANVDQARARLERLKRDEERKRKLFERKNTTQEDLDLSAADRAEAEANLESLTAAHDLAKLNREFTQITSPISGRISRRMIDPGNLIKADDTLLVTVMSLNPIYAYFDIDERSILKIERLIREGKVQSPRDAQYHVQFSLADEENFTRTGAIDFLDNHISPTTGTLRFRATVQNDDLLLTPGMFIRVHVPIGTPHEAILVPEEALSSDQGQRFIYVLNEKDEAVYRRVKIGILKEGRRVIEDGVSLTDRVVVSGLQRVRVGAKVQPKLAENSVPAKTGDSIPATAKSADVKTGLDVKPTPGVAGHP